jgi:protein MpaA
MTGPGGGSGRADIGERVDSPDDATQRSVLSRRSLMTGAASALAVTALGAAGRGGLASGAPTDDPIDATARAAGVATRLAPPVAGRTWTSSTIGTTEENRPIEMWSTRALDRERRRVLVVSGIHGNERVTRPIAERISETQLPDDLSLWIVPSANPDGWAANARRNARDVDLNRNFPWRWSPADGGPGPGSAPETKALMSAVRSVAPDLAVWIHQPLAYVAPLPGCPIRYAEAWRHAVGDRRRDSLDQHGGGETWCARVAGIPTMLVEVATWAATRELVEAHARGFANCIGQVTPR